MKHIVIIALLSMLVTGCATSRHTSYYVRLRDTTLPEIDLTQQPVQEALLVLRNAWKEQTGTDMPVAEVTQYAKYDDPQRHLVTFRARHISYLEAIRLIANLSGYRLSLREGGVVLTDIWPGEVTSFEMKLDDDEIRTGLGLEGKLDADDLRQALSSRGVDFSHGRMKITILTDDLVVFSGCTQNLWLVRSILILIKTGHEVVKRDESQQNP